MFPKIHLNPPPLIWTKSKRTTTFFSGGLPLLRKRRRRDTNSSLLLETYVENFIERHYRLKYRFNYIHHYHNINLTFCSFDSTFFLPFREEYIPPRASSCTWSDKIILICAGEQGAPLHIFPTSAALPCSQTGWASCLGLGEIYNL